MRNIFSRRPSPAFVLAAIALTAALGGTSVAAVKAILPSGSVGTDQIKSGAVTTSKIAADAVSSSKLANGAVTGARIAAGAVTNATIAAGAVTSAKIAAGAVTGGKIAAGAVTGVKIAPDAITTIQVAQGSLLSSDFASGQIPRGPTGPAGHGTQGVQGPPGLSGIQIVTKSTTASSDGVQDVTATCPSGKKVIGGGAQAVGTAVSSAPVAVRESNPTSAGDGWHASAGSQYDSDTGDVWSLTATAICASAA